jgi:hypothetical protein
MTKLLLLAISAGCISADALPTYEPFTEFASTVSSTGSNMVAAVGGVPLGTTPATGVIGSAASGGVFGGIDLATGGLAAPTGESWTSLNFNGLNLSGTTNGAINGVDIGVINDSTATIFPASALSSLLPATFPGYPAGPAITTMAENPAQPLIYDIISYSTNSGVITTNYGFKAESYIVGNSAVLNFSQDITRPTNGTTTVYVSYLLSVAQQGQLGAGNDGRYMAFLCQSNLVLGIGTASTNYQYWAQMFNKFGAGAPNYGSHGLLQKTANSTFYIGACDSSAGKSMASSPVYPSFHTPVFVVGAYQFSASGYDTNEVWANPSIGTFGGGTPPTSLVQIDVVSNAYKMPDIAGLVLIDRTGSGGLGGVGTNYVANLLIGTTWSYVTGGPEFTNQPVSVLYSQGATCSFSGAAVAAAQSVTYQWQRVVGGTTNNLTDGAGTAGGGATVSGSTSNTLTLAGVTSGDVAGSYQLAATASGTGYTLTSQPVTLITDPVITSNPVNVTTNYGGKVTFIATATTSQATMTAQWYFGSLPLTNGVQADGSTVSGATRAITGTSMTTTLTLSNVTYLEDGNYSVLVSNNVNSANSSAPATLVVNDPYIVSQPSTLPLVLAPGGSGSISVTAAGTGLTYQWYGLQNGQLPLTGGDWSGVNTPTLTINGAQSGDADNYYCVVSGSSTATVQSLQTAVFVESIVVGPFSQSDWPTSIAQNGNVDYRVFDPNATFSFPSGWNNVMTIPTSSGDQTWTSATLDGELGYQMTGTYLNLADPSPYWLKYTNVPVIDILLNVYGNASMYDANGNGLPITYSYGNAAIATYIHSGTFPLGANNGQWNWLLLSVTNVIDANGYRIVGDPTYGTTGYGGINGGTIRIEGFGSGFTVRAFAMGPHGAFGTTNQINRFAVPVACQAEPTNNLAWIDFNLNTSNNLSVMNNSSLGETYTVQSGVGPTGDQRTAMLSSGWMEMPILNNYLGQPCNEDLSMQVCLEVYDDPALIGSTFGPYQYATDYQGDLANYTGSPYTLTGSGQWIKVAFYVGPLNLNGVNTAPLTGGPLMQFNGGIPYIDRVEVGLIRTGTNALAGQIPDSNYHINPFICNTNYGYYAEWNPTAGIANNVDIAGTYSTATVGPANDQRTAEVPNSISGGSASYLQWNLLNQVFGPNLQDNADVIISMTYYDDPALAGNTLFPNVYSTLVDGNTGTISPSSPYNQPVTLQGSGKWREAHFELPNVNFQNGASQYVCRYAASAPVYVSRVCYDVIRPCGPFEGIDYLQSLGLSRANAQLNLNWLGQAALQGAPVVTGAYGNVVTVTNTANNIYTSTMTNNTQFFRLQFPGYPTNLSTSPINP